MASPKTSIDATDDDSRDAAAAADTDAVDVPSADASSSPSAVVPAASTKQTRASLTLREKWAVKSFCEQRVAECRARGEAAPSQELLRAEVLAKFGWALGRSTLSRVLLADWKALAATRNAGMKRRRSPLFPAFEAELMRFVSARLAQLELSGSTHNNNSSGTPKPPRALTEAMILEEAHRLKNLHGISPEQLHLSVGWLARFKHRNGIRLRKASALGGAAATGGGVGAKPPQDTALAMAPSFPPSAALGPDLLFDDSTRAFIACGPSSTVTNSAGVAPPFLATSLHGMDAHAQLLHQHTEADAALKRAVLAAAVSGAVDASSSYNAQLPNVSELKRSELCVTIDQPQSRPAALDRALAHVPSAIRPLVCACVSSLAVDLHGRNVVVLGNGSVAEAFVLAALVGRDGCVTCVDNELANVHAAQPHVESHAMELGYPTPNVRFVHGLLPGDSVDGSGGGAVPVAALHAHLRGHSGALSDVALLNCSFHTVSTASEKANLLALAHSLVNEGGEVRVSCVCSSRRLSPAFCSAYNARIAQHEVSVAAAATNMAMSNPLTLDAVVPSDSNAGASLAHATSPLGAPTTTPGTLQASSAVGKAVAEVKELLRSVYIGDFLRVCRQVGFSEVRKLTERAFDPTLDDVKSFMSESGGAKFSVTTFRLFKTAPSADDHAEDYGQFAVFNGGVGDADANDASEQAAGEILQAYRLDRDFYFERGEQVRVDGNTAQLLQSSWLKRFFTVVGDQSTHLGPFQASERQS